MKILTQADHGRHDDGHAQVRRKFQLSNPYNPAMTLIAILGLFLIIGEIAYG